MNKIKFKKIKKYIKNKKQRKTEKAILAKNLHICKLIRNKIPNKRYELFDILLHKLEKQIYKFQILREKIKISPPERGKLGICKKICIFA